MRKLYKPKNQSSISEAAKKMSIEHNVTINVIDSYTGDIVQSHEGHNAATNSLLTGIAHYLAGDGVYNQAYDMLSIYVPKYISLGTMGLFTQEAEEDGEEKGLPKGLGYDTDTLDEVDKEGKPIYYGDAQTNRLCHYISGCPGFGADGYDASENGDRPYFGLGPKFENREFEDTISCELISDSYPRSAISFRDIVPETQAEIPKTLDVVYSALISTAALSQFRGKYVSGELIEDRDYIFITEAGLWSKKTWTSGGENGLLAGYRIVPPNKSNWDLGTYYPAGPEDPEDPSSPWIPSHYDLVKV